jgi:hypothetical protein
MGKKSRANFLDYVPTRQVESITEPCGELVLLVPKFGTSRLGRWWASVIGSRSTLKVHLDELGSLTWSAIDGRRTVAEITLHVNRDEPADDMYDRCSRFIRSLSNAGAVRLDPPSDV